MRGLICDYDDTKSNRNDYGMATLRRWIWRRVWPVGSSPTYICCSLFSRDCRSSWSWWGMGSDRQVMTRVILLVFKYLITHDRERMYKFFMSLKQKDGSFLVARHSEVDVRCASYYASYCFFLSSTTAQRDILSPSCCHSSRHPHARVAREHRRVCLLMPDIRRWLCLCFTSVIFTFW